MTVGAVTGIIITATITIIQTGIIQTGPQNIPTQGGHLPQDTELTIQMYRGGNLRVTRTTGQETPWTAGIPAVVRTTGIQRMAIAATIMGTGETVEIRITAITGMINRTGMQAITEITGIMEIMEITGIPIMATTGMTGRTEMPITVMVTETGTMEITAMTTVEITPGM
jgi:hypothetical protein